VGHDQAVSEVSIAVGSVRILAALEPPSSLGLYQRHAVLVDDFAGDGRYFFLAVADGQDPPSLVVTQRFEPYGPGFAPGVLYVPERRRLFVGAGTRLLCYEGRWRRSWVDEAECGFSEWAQHGDVVLMSAELELAAWTTDGIKLWTTFVEPPWSYRVSDEHHG
jgi:hypothetical protein